MFKGKIENKRQRRGTTEQISQESQLTYQSLTTAKNKYPVYVIVSMALNGLSVVLLGICTLAIIRLAYRPVPTLVQSETGEILKTEPAPFWHREPSVIKNFVGQTFTLLFSWSGMAKLPNEAGELVTQRDPGVKLNNNDVITTPAYEASYALAAEFRESFREKIANLTPGTVWNGKTQVHIEFITIGEPQPIAKGRWKVNLVASLIIRSPTKPSGRALPFNKTVYIRAIDTPPLPLPDEATPLQQTVNNIRLSRIEIDKIQDLEDK